MDNVLYFAHINSIGGVETFFYYLAEKYGDRDITIYYRDGDAKQIERLRKLVRVRKYNGEKIKCKRAFFNYNADIIGNVEADEYVQIIHANYKERGLKPTTSDKITRYVAVSEVSAKAVGEITGKPCEVVYNPIAIKKQPKVLHLVSATRLTKDKGRDRMVALGKALDKAGIAYTWEVFTNDKYAIPNDNIVWRTPRLDILPYIADADYLVQLSNSEGYCYSVVEALTLGTPVIVTPCEVYEELGLNETNSIVIDFDMKKIPIAKIYKGLKKFNYEPPKDKWGELLTDGKSTYDPNKKVKVKVIKRYHDIELDRTVSLGEKFTTTEMRAEMLREKGLVE